MQTFLKLSRLLLPVSFLIYSLIANVNFLRTGNSQVDVSQIALLKGRVASEIDTAYIDSLPHKDISVGLIGAARYLIIGEGREGVIAGRGGWLFTQEETRPLPGDLQQAFAEISEYQQRLASAGAKLILVPVPAKLDVYQDHSTATHAPEIQGIYDRFLAGLTIADIAHVDARSVLNIAKGAEQTFLATDTHWTPHGASQVAGLLAKSEGIPIGATDYTGRTNDQKILTGDLVSFVTSEHLAPFVGLARETVVPFHAVGQTQNIANIFAADTVDTVLIGTSYSANEDWSFGEALKIALSRDVLNLATEGQGPVEPMRDFLNGPEFGDSPPKYVIWEFPVRYLSDPQIWDLQDNDERGV